MSNQGEDIIAITDIGVDDALALVLLDKLAGNRRKVIVPTFGNTNADAVEKNACDFAALMQHKWYVHDSTRLPMNGLPATFSAEDYHGQDGLWAVRPPESTKPFNTIDTIPPGHVISLGPLTQAYSLLKVSSLKHITLMGGYFDNGRDLAVRPQANIRMDIDAAERFFEECEGVEVHVVPHNVTRGVYWTKDTINSIPESSATNVWVKNLMQTWFANCPYERLALHDPIATLLAFEPENAEWITSGVRILRDEAFEGITELARESPPCQIATMIDDPDDVANRIFSLIFEP